MAGLCERYFSAAREIELPETVVATTAAMDLISRMISSTVSFDKAVKKTVRWYIARYPVLLEEYRKRVFFSGVQYL